MRRKKLCGIIQPDVRIFQQRIQSGSPRIRPEQSLVESLTGVK
jgi:hypothetical protein